MKVKVIPRTILCFLLLVSALLFISCASTRSLKTVSTVAPDKAELFQRGLEETKALFYAGDYQAAKDRLQQMAEQDYSLTRLDEWLNWVQRCELYLPEPLKVKPLLAVGEDGFTLPN